MALQQTWVWSDWQWWTGDTRLSVKVCDVEHDAPEGTKRQTPLLAKGKVSFTFVAGLPAFKYLLTPAKCGVKEVFYRVCFSYHHPQDLLDSIIEWWVLNSCFDLNVELSVLHGNDDEGDRSCGLWPDSDLLPIPCVFRSHAAHMLLLNQIHTHLGKDTKIHQWVR